MIEWSDSALVLSARPHGETGVVASVLTLEHGRHAGLVPGGQSRSRAAMLQPGQQVAASWRARLADQLGTFALEPSAPYPAAVLDDSAALAGLTAACAVADAALPERESHPAIYEGLVAFIESLSTPHWPFAYVRLELGLLAELGYGVDLSCCAVTGQTQGLTHVSPRTGRAVCAEAAAPYREKLLPLPGFLAGTGDISSESLQEGLHLTGFFLERCVFAVHHAPLPAARKRLVERLVEKLEFACPTLPIP
jgi:DNA repair protein RecO (recombination protein O)